MFVRLHVRQQMPRIRPALLALQDNIRFTGPGTKSFILRLAAASMG